MSAFVALGCLAGTYQAGALSIALPVPEIHFAKGSDPKRSEAISAVIKDKQYQYLGGLYSLWPPDWSTTLVYKGDTNALSGFLTALSRIEGLSVRLTLSPDLSKETGSALQAGSWWVIYSQAKPEMLTVRLNRAALPADLAALRRWLPKSRETSPSSSAVPALRVASGKAGGLNP